MFGRRTITLLALALCAVVIMTSFQETDALIGKKKLLKLLLLKKVLHPTKILIPIPLPMSMKEEEMGGWPSMPPMHHQEWPMPMPMW